MPEPLLDDARLLLSELLSNSVRHAGLTPGDEIGIRADWRGDRLRIDVRDRTTGSVPSQVAGAIRPEPSSESGWGLYLVDTVATRWGSAPGRYWFEIEDTYGTE